MRPIDVFSSKAEKYARYRKPYAPTAIREIFAATGINRETTLADIGAGTGILTREFAGKVKRVYAIEPNPEMRALLKQELGKNLTCTIVGARAESTALRAQSIEVITAAQAVHWFDAEAAQAEFYRILKPGGWIVFCRNSEDDPALGEALRDVYPPETDTQSLMIGDSTPIRFYYGEGNFIHREYPNRFWINRDEFVGGLATASYAPDEGSELYEDFVGKANEVFDKISDGSALELRFLTEIYLGQINL